MSDITPANVLHPHDIWMKRALDQAVAAYDQGEVPVGAIIVHNGRIIAEACNQREALNDPTAHAEMIAITQAAQSLGSWRLLDCTLYVTLEPCPMCAGAIVHARVARVVYGCPDPRGGAAGTVFNVLDCAELNHRVSVTSGVRADECKALLQRFFRTRR